MQDIETWIPTKVFKNGNSMAIRIPTAFKKIGPHDCLIRQDSNGDLHIRLRQRNILAAFDTLTSIEDFPLRAQPAPQDREGFA